MGTVWIVSTRAKVAPLEEATKMARAATWMDRSNGEVSPPKGEEAPSSIVYCPQEDEDVADGVRRLQALAPEAPVVVFVPKIDPRLASKALRAGARGVSSTPECTPSRSSAPCR